MQLDRSAMKRFPKEDIEALKIKAEKYKLAKDIIFYIRTHAFLPENQNLETIIKMIDKFKFNFTNEAMNCKFCNSKMKLWYTLLGEPSIYQCTKCKAEFNIEENFWLN